MAHQVFISYANDKNSHYNKDFQVAKKIRTALEAKNIRCWMAPRDIAAGTSWFVAIMDAVEKSKLVVLVFSANANQSQWVADEISKASEKNITVIPFRIEKVTPEGRLEVLKLRFQYLEAHTSPLKGHIEKLVKDVKQHLGHAPLPAQPGKMFPNPFTEFMAIHDPARFVGREKEMHRLTTMLRGGSVALQGDPKIGKSSLLRHLSRTWEGNVLSPLDCQSLKDRSDFFQNIAEALKLDRYDWQNIRSTLNDSRILFLLDELDFGSQCGITHTDLALFRSVCDRNRDFKMVVVSRVPLKEVFPDTGRGSPAFNFLVPFTLGVLTGQEARQLLNHPWAPEAPFFDNETCEQLLELTGCHPYKLQRAAFHRFESLADPAYDWQAGYEQDMEQML